MKEKVFRKDRNGSAAGPRGENHCVFLKQWKEILRGPEGNPPKNLLSTPAVRGCATSPIPSPSVRISVTLVCGSQGFFWKFQVYTSTWGDMTGRNSVISYCCSVGSEVYQLCERQSLTQTGQKEIKSCQSAHLLGVTGLYHTQTLVISKTF